MMTPSAGTKLFEQCFTTGQVIRQAGGKEVRPHMFDGNYVVASSHARPWHKQLNMLIGYASFYNPVWLAWNLLRKKTKVSQKAAGMQIVGMLGLFQTIRRTCTWSLRLAFGRISRLTHPPTSAIPMRSVSGESASHAAFEGPISITVKKSRAVHLPIAS